VKVTVSIKGRFHAFDLAKELQRHGYLNRLITSYPKFEVAKYGVARDKCKSLLIYEGNRIWWRAPRFVKDLFNGGYYIDHVVTDSFDRHASYRVPKDTDVFVGWSSASLHSLRQAKRLGAKTIVERGSTHILQQRAILLEEYERYGARFEFAHSKTVEKELREYEEADYIAVPSQFVKRTFLEHGVPGGKLIHVPFGVDLAHFRPVPKQDDVFRVVHCGTLSLRKGVHYLLQAFSELKLPRAELWLIGSIADEIRPFLGKYASATIVHKGPFPEFELHKYYSQSSVFCLASIEEGLARTQMQAMACGLPVIFTTNTGGEDIVRDGQDGFVIPIRDVEVLKERIHFFYENRDACREMGYSAQQRVKSGFTWADYGDKVIAEYQRILKGNGEPERRKAVSNS
jgi:glycosyltransferase involved in cell wall biosynthesis